MSVGQPPPPKTPAAPKPPKDSAATAARTDALTGFGQLAQVPLMAMRQYADVGAVTAHWPGVAREVAKLAETQAPIARLIDPLIQVGPYTGLIAAVLPFVMQIGVNHRMLAPGAMGTVPAAAISAQVEASMAQQELDALRAQYAAEKNAREMRTAMEDERAAFIRAQQEQAA